MEFVDQPHIAERPIDKNARIVYIGKSHSLVRDRTSHSWTPGTDVANVNFLAGQHFGDRTSRVSHYPTNRLARRETCHEPDRLPVEAFQLPSSAVVDQLLNAYFTHVNPGFPVVDQTLFLEQYSARDSQNPPSLLLLHAILVVGAHVHYQDSLMRESMKATFFRRAKTLFDARFERNRDVIVQAALLLSWHADGPEDVAANAWFWIGVAVRTAMGLGMHRDADESTIVPHNRRMWRRVWWLLFQCDVFLSMQYGRPQSIRLEDCDVKKLHLLDFQDCGSHTQALYVIHTTELCIIMARGLRERFRLSATPQSRQQALQSMDNSLAHWSLQLPEALHAKSGSSLDLWPACLQMHYNMMLLLLHRSPPNRDPSREDAEICAMTAGFIQSIFQGICDEGNLHCLWISSINCVFTALIQLSIEIRTSNPIVALPSIMRYDTILTSFRKLVDYWPNAQAILHFFESKTQRRTKPEDASRPTGLSHKKTSLEMVAGTVSSYDISVSTGDRTDGPVSDVLGIPLQSTHLALDETIGSWHEWQDTRWQQFNLENDFVFTF